MEIDTLEELKIAAHDDRLIRTAGIGEKRLAGILACVTERLGRVKLHDPCFETGGPSIEELLDVEREYREKAKTETLHLFAPHDSTPCTKPGFRFFIHNGKSGSILHFLPRRLGPIKKGKPRLGRAVLR